MKKIILVVIFSIALLSGCTKTQDYAYVHSNEKLNIITTIFPQYDFVRQIAGDNVNLHMLIPPGSESHTYDPSPGDIINISQCDVFIYAGGESDEWVREIIQTIDSDTIFISLMDIVPPLEEQHVEGMQDTYMHSHEHHEEYDEHIWTSPVNADIISSYLCDLFCELDADNSDIYAENYNNYSQQLHELDRRTQEVLDNSERNTIIFGDRFPIRYFTEQYNINYYAAFPGCAAEVEPSPKTLIFLTDKIRNENIPVVFYREFSNKKVAQILSEETGAKMLLFHSAHNITSEEFYDGITYVDIMSKNIDNLTEALN